LFNQKLKREALNILTSSFELYRSSLDGKGIGSRLFVDSIVDDELMLEIALDIGDVEEALKIGLFSLFLSLFIYLCIIIVSVLL
jgi:hypothetical protein